MREKALEQYRKWNWRVEGLEGLISRIIGLMPSPPQSSQEVADCAVVAGIVRSLQGRHPDVLFGDKFGLIQSAIEHGV